MDKVKIKKALQKIVDEKVKAYKTDFSIDVANLARKRNSLPMLFLARTCGTLLVSFCGVENMSSPQRAEYISAAKSTLHYYLEAESESVWLYAISCDRVQEITSDRLAKVTDFLDQAQLLLEIA